MFSVFVLVDGLIEVYSRICLHGLYFVAISVKENHTWNKQRGVSWQSSVQGFLVVRSMFYNYKPQLPHTNCTMST